jgi:dipeptidyl aminopeptidase/acylaminoacyl peptidase
VTLRAAALAGAGLVLMPAPGLAACEGLLPPAVAAAQRPITPADLVQLRETGWAHGEPDAPPPMSLSPDGGTLALVLRRGDPETNRICVGLMLVSLADRSARLIDTSDVLLRDRAPSMGLADQPSGRPLFNQPRWSGDGRWIYYLRDHKGRAQVWRVDRRGSSAAPVTAASDGVIHFGLAGDGDRVVYSTRPGLETAKLELDAQGRRGWVYDRRFAALLAARPSPMTIQAVAMAVDVKGGSAGSATEQDIQDSGVRLGEVTDALHLSQEDPSWRLWSALTHADRPFGPSRLRVAYRGEELVCPDQVCGGRVWAGWSVGGAVAVLRESDVVPGHIELILWRPGRPPRRLRHGPEVLSGCVPAKGSLICLEEAATQAPRIVRVSLEGRAAGRSQLVLDLNPEFGALRLGEVRRLRWRDVNGFDAYGDLALPLDHRPGQRHPLIVVQYQSRGLLRGGSGNEFPVHPLAARGFAVLSVNQPRRAIAARGADATDAAMFQASMYEGLWQRRALLAALDAGVDAALATGAIDSERIGLTGMSDGAVTAVFALIQSSRYKAAALGPGWLDPVTYTALLGPAFSDVVARWGLPPATADTFWRDVSLARNLDRVTLPILVQTGDAELRGALESFEAYRRGGRPIEMIVYPDEYHNKWQPAHLEAMYERCIAWFDFWLRDVPPSAETDPDRPSRWAVLRRLREASSR